MSRLPHVSSLARAALGLLPLVCGPAFAVTIVLAGTVSDSSTGAPVSGADVVLRKGGAELGSTVTAADGQFQLPFDIVAQPQAQNLKLFVRRDGFVAASQDVVVTSGAASRKSFALGLIPQSVSGCIRSSDHAVVVGYFRPAAGSAGDPDIAGRVADALNYDLLTRMQQALNQKSLPSIVACGGARPQAVVDYSRFAKVLHADAFLVGSVNDAALRKVKVDIVVVDRLDLLAAPLRVSSKDVNLDDPELARLDVAAHAAILTALVGGYEQARKFAECIDFTSAAARILGPLPSALESARQRCLQQVPNRGLLSGNAP